jgi:hypothetical protein|nr:MAG TPA: tail length tape measure protein [Caudoviricetes sp.]
MADNNNPIKYSDLVKPDDSISKLIAQLDQLSDAYMNTLNNIKSEAITVKAALQGVSGATESGRKSIQGATSDADKLAKAAREVRFAESENAKTLATLNQARKEANELNKLIVRRNQAAEGSYNKLSAQYSINKIYLNNMTVEEREATEEGRKLVAETKAIYDEMKRLQEATGKTSLNVGNYSDAAKGLTTQIENQTKQLALLRLEGKQGTAEYQNLAKETAVLRDAVKDATKEITNMASDTSTLDSVLGLAAGASGGFAAYTGALELFGGESEAVEEAQKKLQAAIALTTGVQAIQNAVQKQSALMLGISRIQQAALTKAKVYDRLVTMQGTKATLAATVAQKAFNLIASANPYVLLAVALITVIGALVAFSSGTKQAAEQQNRLNELQKAHLDYLDIEAGKLTTVSNERIRALERELQIAQARNAGTTEIRKIEDKLAAERRRANAEQRGFYATEIKELDDNRAKLEQYRKSLIKLNELKAQRNKKIVWDVELDGNIETYKVDDAINIAQAKIDNYGRMVDIAVNLTTEKSDLDTADAVTAAKRQQEQKDAYKTELDLLRKAEDAKNALIQNSYDRQRATTQAANARQIADLQYQLKTDANLTARGRAAINATIVALRQQLTNDLVDLENQERAQILSARRATQDAEIAAMVEGSTKQQEQLRVQYERQIEDIQTRLETERGLTEEQTAELNKQLLAIRQQYANDVAKLNDQINIDQLNKEANAIQLRLDAVRKGSAEEIALRTELLQKQRALELAQNRQLAADVRQSEADINAKWDAEILKQTTELNQQRALMLFDQQQALAQSEFDLLRNSEARKTQFALAAEKARLQKILELNKTAGVKMTDEQVQTIQNTIAKIDQEIQQSKGDERGNDIYGLFGLNLDDDQKEAISTSMQYAMDALNQITEARVQAAAAAVTAADKEVDSAQKALDAELNARANGYASSVVQAQKDLDLAKKTQEKALKEQQKAQKQQQAIQTIQQIGNLVTSTALIWSQLGFPWAIPAIAIMWGSFAAAKIKAAQMTKSNGGNESYGDGTVELLGGGSHQSGNDVDLGTKPNGTRRRAEGGEFFAVFNKRNSRRYRRIIPDVVNALNRGIFERKYMNAYKEGGEFTINVSQNSPDMRDLQNDVRAIREQNAVRYYTTADGKTIMIYKNLKRTIN